MEHRLSLEPYLPFILVRNISPTLNEISAKEILTRLFAQKTELFGVPQEILIGLPVDRFTFENDIVNSLRAYVRYQDYRIHGRVADHFDNTLSFGRILKLENILVDNFRSPLLRANFVGMDYFQPESDGGFLGTIEIGGHDCIKFSHLSYLIDLTTPINARSTDVNNGDLNPFYSNTSVTQETANSSSPALNTSKSNENSLNCSRCFKSFGSGQNEFESHIRQCKVNEITSMSSCIRQAICSICQYKFLQTATKNISFLPCGHILHRKCFEKMKKENNTEKNMCPNCKHELPKQWIGKIIIE